MSSSPVCVFSSPVGAAVVVLLCRCVLQRCVCAVFYCFVAFSYRLEKFGSLSLDIRCKAHQHVGVMNTHELSLVLVFACFLARSTVLACDIPSTPGGFYVESEAVPTSPTGKLVFTSMGEDFGTGFDWVRICNEGTADWSGRLVQAGGGATFPGLAASSGDAVFVNVGEQKSGATFVLQHEDSSGKWVQDSVKALGPQQFEPAPLCAPFSMHESACSADAGWCVIDNSVDCASGAAALGLIDTTPSTQNSNKKAPGCRHKDKRGGILLFNSKLTSPKALPNNELFVCKRCSSAAANATNPGTRLYLR